MHAGSSGRRSNVWGDNANEVPMPSKRLSREEGRKSSCELVSALGIVVIVVVNRQSSNVSSFRLQASIAVNVSTAPRS